MYEIINQLNILILQTKFIIKLNQLLFIFNILLLIYVTD